MKRTNWTCLMTLLGGACAVAWGASSSSDTGWGGDYSSALPSDVRQRLQDLRRTERRSSGSATADRKSLKGERERLLQSLPSAEQERLRERMRQIEERPSGPQDPHGFRDK